MTGQNDDDDDGGGGYCKPPKKHQFKKGQSGCPSGGHRKRRLNKLERKEKEAEKLKERQKALEDIVQQVASEDQVVRTKRGPVKMANKEIVVRKIFQRAMREDADDKDLRRCIALLDKVGMLKPTVQAPAGSGVLVIYSPMQLAEWEAATEGQLLSIDPLEGIPGTEGIFDQPYARERRPPDDDLD
jgi:hypothetical protein